MIKNTGITVGLAAVLWLVGCIRENKPLTGPGDEKSTGEARLYLPAIPKGFLAKIAKDTTQIRFELTITGPGMAPMVQSWDLPEINHEAVVISGIPVGPERLFTGRLVSGTLIGYEGKTTVAIERGKTTQVYLKLVSAATGAAAICVEIEGIPPSPWCRRDTVINLSGCWSIESRPWDTLQHPFVRGHLRIDQGESTLTATPTLENYSFGVETGIRFPGDQFLYFAFPHKLDSGSWYGHIMYSANPPTIPPTLTLTIRLNYEWKGSRNYQLIGTRIQCRESLPPVASPAVGR